MLKNNFGIRESHMNTTKISEIKCSTVHLCIHRGCDELLGDVAKNPKKTI